MSRVLFFSVPLAAAGISTWRWYLQPPRPPDPPPAAKTGPVYIPSRFPPVEVDETATSRRPSVLQLHARPLARLRTADASQRRQATAAIAQLHDLDDGDCWQLAQTLDYRSALLLSNWTTTDLRLFLPPPGARGACAAPSLELRLRRLLEALPAGTPCAEFATARALRHPPPADWEPAPLAADPAELTAPAPWRAAPAQAVEADCLEALLERAESAPQRAAMLDGGLLDLLAAAHAERPRDAARCSLLARTLAHFPSARQLHQSGWLGLLAAWSREEDVRVGPAAWRVIRNLTLAEGLMESPTSPAADPPPALVAVEGRWAALRSRVAAALSAAGWPAPPEERSARRLQPLPDGVLVLHPRSVTAEAATAVDVVFVHGLLGGTARTWRQHDEARALLQPPAEPRLSQLVLRTPPTAGAAPEAAPDTAETRQDVRTAAQKPTVPGESSADGSSPPTAGSTSANGTVSAASRPAGLSSVPTATAVVGRESRPGGPGGGGAVYSQCWPRDWLPADLAPLPVRVLSVDYDSVWSDWRPRCAARRARSLASRAAELRRQLLTAGLGDRPIVWVTHSMGGLLVKQMLVDAEREAAAVSDSRGGSGGRSGRGSGGAGGSDSAADGASGDISGGEGGDGSPAGTRGGGGGTLDPLPAGTRAVADTLSSDVPHPPLTPPEADTSQHPADPLLSATRGVLFFSCPHSGSRLASVSPALRPLLLPSAELDALRRHAPALLELRAEFVALCARRRLCCLSVAETRRQRLLGREVLFVEPESAHAGVGRMVLADADHLGVCKPPDRHSEVYRLAVQFIRHAC